ncbi:MAG: DNA mismatch repair endonuclease MutL, partial [Clostridia bacterium]|nr:DNA mismatch repair endonuclease MutL [Clostridia bacterium]
MAIIHSLDNATINQIAAGEVIERPSSIVKELMENSIDADASAITIEIENGGTSLIRVTDNGTGMEMEDAEASFQRHATSKIEAANDLNTIHTLGFRGEALASIAAVTQMEMLTRPGDSISGCHIIYHGGQMIQASEAGCPEGTTIMVRNLFYNTPARLKFLKSSRSETAAISELLAKLILANPSISIKYISNGKTVYHSSGDGELLSAILCIYGKNIKNDLILLEDDFGDGFSVFGYVGKPSLSRTNRSHQSFFINNRYVRSQLLSQSVEEGMKDWTMINHFPWCILSIQILPGEIDVNVHPSKTEIRFRNPKEVLETLTNSIKNTMEKEQHIPAIFPSIPTVQNKAPKIGNDLHQTKAEQLHYFDGQKLQSTVEHVSEEITTVIELSEFKEQTSPKTIYIHKDPQEENLVYDRMNHEEYANTITSDLKKWNVIGVAFSTFILVENDTHLFIVDQHAAHERLIYEQLKESVLQQNVLSQQLSPPYILELTHDEFLYITDNVESFQFVGFDLEPFGGKSFIIRGVPVVLKDVNIQDLFHELLDLSGSRIG